MMNILAKRYFTNQKYTLSSTTVMSCPPNQVYVPGYCRNAATTTTQSKSRQQKQKKLTKKEREAIKSLMALIKPDTEVSGERTPQLVGERLRQAPHLHIDMLTHDLRVSYFVLPRFFPGAITRMLDPQRRKQQPDPHKRFQQIEKEFQEHYRVKVDLPVLYEYIVLRGCLMMG